MTRRYGRVEGNFNSYVEVLDEDGELHHLTWYQVMPPLREHIRTGTRVVIQYFSTQSQGAWNIVEVL